MKKETLSDAIGMLDERLLETSLNPKQKQNSFSIKKAIAAAVAVVLSLSAVFGMQKLLNRKDVSFTNNTSDNTYNDHPNGSTPNDDQPSGQYIPPTVSDVKYAVIDTDYPTEINGIGYYNYHEEKENTLDYKAEDAKKDSLSLTRKMITCFLNNNEQNTVFSPFSIYMSLASLAEISEGETRTQILELLNVSSIEELRINTRAMFLNIYCNGKYYGLEDEEVQSCIPANSLWLNGTADITGDPLTAKMLKENYYTSFYKGDPADVNFQESYRNWINDHTGGLLSDQLKNTAIPEESVLSMLNTLYLNTTWIFPFLEDQNTRSVFYGTDVNRAAEYMNEVSIFGNYYKGDGFTAYSRPTKSNCSVLFMLPDEGIDLSSFIADEVYMELLQDLQNHNTDKYKCPEGYDAYRITLSIPKFDVSSQCDLKSALQANGITNIFDSVKAEIPFVRAANDNIYLTNANQDVRMQINERGVSAAAITISDYGLGDPIYYDVDFILNRPFMVFVTSGCNTPLFAGVINNFD